MLTLSVSLSSHRKSMALIARPTFVGATAPSFRRQSMTDTATLPNSLRNQPDERGHFGQFGGRFVAETLMPLILDLEREYRAAKADPAFQAQFDDLLEHYVGRPSPLYYAERLTEHCASPHLPGARRQDLFQARGAEPHRRAQDQQLHRPDPARDPHGQDADHRRDRRGPARRRHRHRRGALRAALHDLHGRQGHRAAEAQRLPHEAARRRGPRRSPAARRRSRTR
jgi:hypothetical protein